MYNSNEYNELIMHLENHEDKETSIHGPRGRNLNCVS